MNTRIRRTGYGYVVTCPACEWKEVLSGGNGHAIGVSEATAVARAHVCEAKS